MNNKNTALNCTNPRITGNVKIVLDSSGNIFFESINSSQWLSRVIFKGFKYNKTMLYRTNLRNFINQTIGTSRLYDVVDISSMQHTNDLYQQYHYLYQTGCYSEESQLIDENFRYFAPISIEDVSSLPSHFVVLKTNSSSNQLSEVLNDGYSLVESFDLNEINERIFSSVGNSGIMTSMSTLQISGYDISTGNDLIKYEDNPIIMNEQTITEDNNWMSNAYKRNNMIYTNIVNMEFAFTDAEVDGTFKRYLGFYVNLHEHESIEKLNGSIRLIETEKSLINYDQSYELKTFFGRQFSVSGNGFGAQKQAILDIEMFINPESSTIMQFVLDGIVESTLIIKQEIINNNVNVTRRNVARLINNSYTGTSTTISAEVHGNNIRLLTNNFLDDDEKLEFITSSKALNVVKSKLGTRTNEFVKPNSFTILSNAYFNPEKFTHVMFEIDEVKSYIKILDINDYLGQYLYVLEKEAPKLKPGSIFWLVEELTEKAYVCKIMNMSLLDMNTELRNYETVVDYDKALYFKYLISTLESPFYRGSAAKYFNIPEEQLTSQQINTYRSILIGKIQKYFENVEENNLPFIKSINPTTLISEIVNDPYDRLDENEIPALRRVGRLYQFINKWSSGIDSTNNNNILNMALPLKHESLNASHIELNRDIYKNTHDWFVLCDGLPRYELSGIQKSSYSSYPLDSASFESNEFDAYDYLKHITESKTYECFSFAKYDSLQKASFAYFKGVKYRIEKNIDDYKFSVVVKTSEQILDDVVKVKVINNEKFKTYTIYVNFYIPEPILTSLELGDRYYFVDKSLMYFSNEVYESVENSVDFGKDRISLDLYNNSDSKRYLGNLIPHNNWWHTTSQNETILYVQRGNSGIFNTPLNEILTVGNNFSIDYTSSENQNSPWYGMVIDFIGIVEAGANHFWCKQIIVRSNLNDDINGDDDNWHIDENVVKEIINIDIYQAYLQNNMLFYQNNTAYISKAIAFELCFYDKVITQKANNARYKELCLSNFKQYLKSNVLSEGQTSTRVYVEDMKIANISVMIKSEVSNQITSTQADLQSRASYTYPVPIIEKLAQPYSYVIYRQNLLYKPLTSIIQEYYGIDGIESVYPRETNYISMYNKIVSKVDNEFLDVLFAKQYESIINLQTFYDYVKAFNNEALYVSLPWACSPQEIRTPLISYVMNTSEKIETTSYDGDMNLVKLFKSYILKIVNVPTLLSNLELNNYMNITTNSTINTLVNYDAIDIILSNFIQNSFMKIYRVESIVDNNGKMLQFVLFNGSILIDDNYQLPLKIKLTR